MLAFKVSLFLTIAIALAAGASIPCGKSGELKCMLKPKEDVDTKKPDIKEEDVIKKVDIEKIDTEKGIKKAEDIKKEIPFPSGGVAQASATANAQSVAGRKKREVKKKLPIKGQIKKEDDIAAVLDKKKAPKEISFGNAGAHASASANAQSVAGRKKRQALLKKKVPLKKDKKEEDGVIKKDLDDKKKVPPKKIAKQYSPFGAGGYASASASANANAGFGRRKRDVSPPKPVTKEDLVGKVAGDKKKVTNKKPKQFVPMGGSSAHASASANAQAGYGRKKRDTKDVIQGQ